MCICMKETWRIERGSERMEFVNNKVRTLRVDNVEFLIQHEIFYVLQNDIY